MYDADNNNNNNKNNENNDGGLPCHNNPRCLECINKPQTNVCHIDFKIGLLQIVYVNLFSALDHED